MRDILLTAKTAKQIHDRVAWLERQVQEERRLRVAAQREAYALRSALAKLRDDIRSQVVDVELVIDQRPPRAQV